MTAREDRRLGQGPGYGIGAAGLGPSARRGAATRLRGARSPVAILQGAGGKGGGGPSAAGAPAVGSLPHLGRRGWSPLPTSPPPRSSISRRAGCKSSASAARAGRTPPPGTQLPHVAGRLGHPQPAGPTHVVPLSPGVVGVSEQLGHLPAPPLARLLRSARAHVGGGTRVRKFPAPTTLGECRQDARSCHSPTVPWPGGDSGPARRSRCGHLVAPGSQDGTGTGDGYGGRGLGGLHFLN